MAAYADPQPLLDAFTAAARRAIAAGATVIVPGEGPLNVFLADQGVAEVDGVPVLDSLGTCVRVAELRAAQHRATGLRPSRVGFYGAQPPRALLDAARVVLRRPGGTGVTDVDVDVAVAGGGAAGLMTALRASLDEDLVVAVFEKSTREGCNAAISSGSLAAGGTRFQRAAGIDDSPSSTPTTSSPPAATRSGDRSWRRSARSRRTLVEWIADTGYPIEIGTDMPRAGMSVPRLHTDVGRLGGGRLMRHLRDLLDRPTQRRLRRRGAGRRAAHRRRPASTAWSSSRTAPARRSARARPCWPSTASPPTRR